MLQHISNTFTKFRETVRTYGGFSNLLEYAKQSPMEMNMKANLNLTIVTAFAVIASSVATAQEAKTDLVPVAVQPAVLLSPENSRISFVGIHVGDDPKPRLGGFEQFQGAAFLNAKGDSIVSMTFNINIDSLWTQFEKLTGHLKNEDFFETAKYPTAQFVSTNVQPKGDGQCIVTGNLTLHGQTKEISFPAEYKFDNGGMVLRSKFQIDRSEFGMDKMLSGVYKIVDVELVVGEKTVPKKADGGHGGDSKKKKQSRNDKKTKTRQVSVKLPNMT